MIFCNFNYKKVMKGEFMVFINIFLFLNLFLKIELILFVYDVLY